MFWNRKSTRSIPVDKSTEAAEFYSKTLKQLMTDKHLSSWESEKRALKATLEIFGQLDDEWSDYDSGK